MYDQQQRQQQQQQHEAAIAATNGATRHYIQPLASSDTQQIDAHVDTLHSTVLTIFTNWTQWVTYVWLNCDS